VISLVQRGRDCSDDGAKDRGSNPKESFRHRASPRKELPFSIDVKGGEIVTLMWRNEQ
jgi:hypothetical protein